MNLALRFLGVGNAQAVALGSACAVIERDDSPLLMIDCGPDALTSFLERYQSAPAALFITHAHMDHVGGLERLFFKTWFDGERRGKLRVYAHAALIPVLQSRVADYPEVLAEGGANFWDAFQLIPVSRGFWHEGLWFDVFPTRHHAPMTSFGLALRGSMVWTGDTRPIPEALSAVAAAGELVAHDCVLHGNPSHSGVDDLEREYPTALRERLVLYHYGSLDEAEALRGCGYRVANRGEGITLANPHAEAVLASRGSG
ncbi:MAG: MBL fold metallo-hydrolase [Gammaproteobacteria bacterium]|nr:MAG: MBL fold metallo-hydrolase [Gammaproteobacteria bacterium]